MLEPGSSLAGNQNSATSTPAKKRESIQKWPTVKEMGSLLNCISCNCATPYPFMQCGDGHIICLEEGQRMEKCLCGAALIRSRLRWYKFMTERALYSCPTNKDCTGTLVGLKDRGNHVQLTHESQKQFDQTIKMGSIAEEINSDESEEEASLEEMFQLKTKGKVYLRTENVLDTRPESRVSLHGPVVEEYPSPKKPVDDENDDEVDDPTSERNMYGYGDVTEAELGKLFRLSKEEEKLYYKNKHAMDHEPGLWSRRIRGNRLKIPLSAIHRELNIIKTRANIGKPYKRDRTVPSPPLRDEEHESWRISYVWSR